MADVPDMSVMNGCLKPKTIVAGSTSRRIVQCISKNRAVHD
jgi:hypothetical protein